MRLDALSIGYSRPVCAPLTAQLGEGDFVCLVGRNGTGKSTLLRTLAGLLPPLGGDVFYDGNSLRQMTPQEVARTLAIVLTHLPDLRHTTALRIAAAGRLPYTDLVGTLRPDDLEAAAEALRTVGISHLADRLFHTLSDGEKQKTMLARALAQGTPYLLLDEPTAFLDYPSRRELFDLLRSLAHDLRKAILLSTHDLELAVATADSLWHLHDTQLSVCAPATFNLANI